MSKRYHGGSVTEEGIILPATFLIMNDFPSNHTAIPTPLFN
jgi:hypothetical protein